MLMTNEILREHIVKTLKREITDFDYREIYNQLIVLEGDEFSGGARWLAPNDYHIIYDYYNLLQSFMDYGYSEDEAEDYIMSNTRPALPNLRKYGLAPTLLYILDERTFDESRLIPIFY